MAKGFVQTFQWHDDMYCHDLEVTRSNPSRVEFGVHNTSVLSRTWRGQAFFCFAETENNFPGTDDVTNCKQISPWQKAIILCAHLWPLCWLTGHNIYSRSLVTLRHILWMAILITREDLTRQIYDRAKTSPSQCLKGIGKMQEIGVTGENTLICKVCHKGIPD